MENGADKRPSTPGALQSLLLSYFTERLCFLSTSLKLPLARNWLAIELAVTGQDLGWELQPVRWLKVFHATLLEWVKSMPLTVSSQFLYVLCQGISWGQWFGRRLLHRLWKSRMFLSVGQIRHPRYGWSDGGSRKEWFLRYPEKNITNGFVRLVQASWGWILVFDWSWSQRGVLTYSTQPCGNSTSSQVYMVLAWLDWQG